jgi:ribonuclease HII
VAAVSADFINKKGLAAATAAAMRQALKKLKVKPDFHLVDFFKIKNVAPEKQRSLKHGDTLVASIAAASVIAKVHRDRLLKRLHRKYPRYGFAQHKGYGTPLHQEALRKYGPCPLHRRAFLPA